MLTENQNKLISAIENNNIDEIKDLIDKEPEIVNEVTEDEMTPLLFAVKNGKKEAFDLLVASGAETTSNKNNIIKLLTYAIIGGNIDILNSILEKNPDPKNKYIALYAAITSNKSDAVMFLIKKGVDVQTALAQAAGIYGDKPRPEIVSLLLKNGAKLEGNIETSIAVSLVLAAIATAITAVILAIASAPFWILAPVAAGVALFILGVSVYYNKTKNDAILKMAKDFETEQEAKSISGDKSKTQEPAKATEIAQNPISQRDKLDEQDQSKSQNL